MIWGKATDETLDRDQQIVDADFAAKALGEWFNELGAPVRNMHSGTYPPAGKGLALDVTDDGAYVRAKIVEPTAIKLVNEGVYKDLSVGIFDPEIEPDPRAPGGRIVDGWIGEVSLVDLGSNKNAHFAIAKMAKRHGSVELIGVGQDLPAALRKTVETQRPKKGNKKMATKAKKDATADTSSGDDTGGDAKCSKCGGKGVIGKGGFPCPKCKGGKGKAADAAADKTTGKTTTATNAKTGEAGLAAALATAAGSGGLTAENAGIIGGAVAAATTSAILKDFSDDDDDADGEVNDALDDLSDDLDDAMGAQAADDKLNKGDGITAPTAGDTTGSSTTVDSDVTTIGTGDKMGMDGVMKDKKKSKSKSKKGAKTKAKKGGGLANFGDNKAEPIGSGGKPGKTDDDDKTDGKTPPPKKGKGKKGSKAANKSRVVKAKGKAKSKKRGKGKQPTSAPSGGPVPGVTAPNAGNYAHQGGKSTKGKKGKADKTPELPPAALRLHDVLCPCYPTDAVKTHYPLDGLPVADIINPRWFADRLNALTSGDTKASPDSVGEAYQAFAAATKLAGVTLPNFEDIRNAATKTFADAYPNVTLKPGLIDPAQFQRGFLSGAVDETSTTTRVPTPDLHAGLAASQFQRAALTDNETRPTLSGGTSVAKGKKGKKSAKGGVPELVRDINKNGSRVFYTNTAKDDSSSAMALLHDHIAQVYPGICPLAAVSPGAGIDSDGQIGMPAEMNGKGPDLKPVPMPSGAGGGTLQPAKAAKGKKTKGVQEAPVDKRAVEALIGEAVAKVERKQARKTRRLTRRLAKANKALRAPDPRRAAFRGTANFQSKKADDPEMQLRKEQARTHVAALKTRMADRNSVVSEAAAESLRAQLSPEEFARIAVAD